MSNEDPPPGLVFGGVEVEPAPEDRVAAVVFEVAPPPGPELLAGATVLGAVLASVVPLLGGVVGRIPVEFAARDSCRGARVTWNDVIEAKPPKDDGTKERPPVTVTVRSEPEASPSTSSHTPSAVGS